MNKLKNRDSAEKPIRVKDVTQWLSVWKGVPVADQTTRTLITRGKLKAFRRGGTVLIWPSDLKEYMAAENKKASLIAQARTKRQKGGIKKS